MKTAKNRLSMKYPWTWCRIILRHELKNSNLQSRNLQETRRWAKKWQVAIIHTESFYNPKAYNRHGNAYGMMQIVPKYAGQTMNYSLLQKKGKPSSKQLYDPKINLEMGIGYIRWLANNKWPKVKNKTNQYWAIICSYNGGPGTIYKSYDR